MFLPAYLATSGAGAEAPRAPVTVMVTTLKGGGTAWLRFLR